MGTHVEVPGWEEGDRSDIPKRVEIDWKIDGLPFVVGVDSETRDNTFHWVFWDGKVVRDPAPHVPDERPRSDYDCKVVDMYPILYIANE